MPASFGTSMILDGAEFGQKLKTAMIFARESSGIIRLQLTGDELKIIASSSAIGSQESTMPAKVLEGGNQEIAFNGKYVQDFLNTLKPKEIWFGMNESLKPAVFRPAELENYQYVVMPFRVNQ
jgi:DNA polymerase-3 subunit beta